MFIDYYTVLNLHPSCTSKDVREAYKQFALLYHPDRADPSFVDNFRSIKEAYDVLSDPARRYLYDMDYVDTMAARNRYFREQQRKSAPVPPKGDQPKDARSRMPRRPPQASEEDNTAVVSTTSFASSSSLFAAVTPHSASRSTQPPSAAPWPASDGNRKVTEQAVAEPVQQVSALRASRGLRRARPEGQHQYWEGSGQSQDSPSHLSSHAGRTQEPHVRDSYMKGNDAVPDLGSGGNKIGGESELYTQSRGFATGTESIGPGRTTLLFGETSSRPQKLETASSKNVLHSTIIKTWSVFFNLEGAAVKGSSLRTG
uniref:Putative heat shock-like protein n=1 Tax=Trypanosoma vivax (strain Y486) TaxID=1055687 RepID=G0U322_TRYVY|nr:putative heat shock-like protein [Trypanosoma vivax Y486]